MGGIMNVLEKRDFIHSHLHNADERMIDEFYNVLRQREALKAKLETRALKSEADINSGKVYSREEMDEKLNGFAV